MEEMDASLRARFEARLAELQMEHRDLDAALHRLAGDPLHDQLALRRMKKRKLLLKDQITSIERQLDPDIVA
jgi:hypothetical protein